MVDSIRAYGRISEGNQFEFSLDGISTAKQMERLISLTEKLAKRFKVDVSAQEQQNKLQTENNKLAEQEIANKKKLGGYEEDVIGRMKGLSGVSDVLRGEFKFAARDLGGLTSGLAFGVGTIIGSLTGYADQLQLGLQRGISGGIMDFAIAAKTGGVSIGSFSKALEESGGSFAMLGNGATNGAKNFGNLISSVRTATASVGNLGLSNEQQAIFAAQQLKVAVAQGFKGKAAFDLVTKNSRALGNELDTLANRTGKSVLELTQAAIKLAQDPIVANFVQTAKNGGAQISKAAQQFGASLRGIFGEAGDAIAADALKTALGNLPLVITQTGKNMISASSAVYLELERQAKIVKNGGDITAEDQEKLRDTVLKEVEARGQELRMLANLEGQAGDGARQLLELAKQANFYNSAAGAQRREEDKQAQAFNTAINKFKANLQALAIPFLNLLNGIDWTTFINVISGVVSGLEFVLHILDPLGKALGIGPGGLAGLVLGLGAVMIIGVAGYKLVNKSVLETAEVFKLVGLKMKALADKIAPGMGPGIGSFPGGPVGYEPPGRTPMSTRTKIGLGAAGIAGLALPYAADYAKSTGNDNLASAANIAGSALTWGATGASLGSAIPVIGTVVGGIIGAVGGAVATGFSEWSKSESADGLSNTAGDAVDQNNRYQEQNLSELRTMNRNILAQNSGIDATATYNARQTALLGDSVRLQRNSQFMPT